MGRNRGRKLKRRQESTGVIVSSRPWWKRVNVESCQSKLMAALELWKALSVPTKYHHKIIKGSLKNRHQTLVSKNKKNFIRTNKRWSYPTTEQGRRTITDNDRCIRRENSATVWSMWGGSATSKDKWIPSSVRKHKGRISPEMTDKEIISSTNRNNEGHIVLSKDRANTSTGPLNRTQRCAAFTVAKTTQCFQKETKTSKIVSAWLYLVCTLLTVCSTLAPILVYGEETLSKPNN